jgi:hypothetical protein
MLLGQTGREMFKSNWTSSHFRLSCHNFEPFIESKEVERLRTDMIRGWMKSSVRPKRIAPEGN